MTYRLIVILDDGVTEEGAHGLAAEIQHDYEADVDLVTVVSVTPERPSDD